MPRTTLTFELSDACTMQDLLQEFALHDGVVAQATSDRSLTVDVVDTPAALWEARATVGMFDENAVELPDLAEEQPA